MILAICLAIGSTGVVSATTVGESEPALLKETTMFVGNYISSLENTVISDVIFLDNLYSPQNDNVIARLYRVGDGYAIIGINTLNVYEYSLSSANPYSSVSGKKYYGGYFEYYDSNKRHIYEGYAFTPSASLNEITDKETSPTSKLHVSDEPLAMPRANARGQLNGTLSTAWINGKCGPTSAYIMLQYKGYIDTSMTANETINYLDGLMGPVSLSTLKSGTNKALSNWGYSVRVSSASYSFSLVKSQIDRNKPLTLGTNGGGLATDGHVQTIHGYAEQLITRSTTAYVLYVNNSWGQNNVAISYQGSAPSYLKDHIYFG